MQKKPPSIILIFGVIAALAIFVGLNKYLNMESTADHEHETKVTESAPTAATKPAPKSTQTPQTSKGNKKTNMVVLETARGTMKIKLFEDEMPISVANFKELVDKKFYDGLTFHRVEDWVIQGGDPTGTGTGGSDKTIKLEINKKHGFDKAGMVGMARSNNPDSATSQFFIVTKPSSFLNDGYACFGEVVEGGDVIKKIERGDKMSRISFALSKIEKP